jgi:hypothetical protein
MIARSTLLLVFCLAWMATAHAETPQTATLAYRFTQGKATQQQVRITGELRMVSGAESTPIVIDAASRVLSRVVSVSPSGEGILSVRTLSSVANISIGDQRVSSLQDMEGVSVLVNGAPLKSPGTPPGEVTLSIEPNGRVAEAKVAGDEMANKVLGLATDLSVVFPENNIAVGEKWGGSMRISLPAEIGIPDMTATAESVLRGLRIEDGRLVATIVTTSDGVSTGSEAPSGGTSRESVTLYTRFDVEAGELLDSDGEVSVDVELTPGGGALARLIGRMHFTTATMPAASEETMAASPSPEQPEVTAPAPPPEEAAPIQPPAAPMPGPVAEAVAPTLLGEAHAGWKLSGGETLRFYGSPSAGTCRRDCEGDTACQAYTWVRPGGYQPGDPPTCYLMRSFQTASRHACCITATRAPFPGQ